MGLTGHAIKGDDTARLHPLDLTTRAEAVTVLLRLLDVKAKS
ncbi:hypothetical protein [Paenibacillus solanacearum]|nr:hypothetical protein [Paenibacillus solanacearum]